MKLDVKARAEAQDAFVMCMVLGGTGEMDALDCAIRAYLEKIEADKKLRFRLVPKQ